MPSQTGEARSSGSPLRPERHLKLVPEGKGRNAQERCSSCFLALWSGCEAEDTREFLNILTAAGWQFVREGGEHEMWGRADQFLAIPRGTTISVGVVRQFHQKNAKADEEGA